MNGKMGPTLISNENFGPSTCNTILTALESRDTNRFMSLDAIQRSFLCIHPNTCNQQMCLTCLQIISPLHVK